MYNNKKVGNFGSMSTFSFYFGHHMSTIEGGMISTNDEELYNLLLFSIIIIELGKLYNV
jgi:CDP-6-deoxy-D-xylo-4-hexulose-3-dehydrase